MITGDACDEHSRILFSLGRFPPLVKGKGKSQRRVVAEGKTKRVERRGCEATFGGMTRVCRPVLKTMSEETMNRILVRSREWKIFLKANLRSYG